MIRREGRITGSNIKVIDTGSYKAWNTLSEKLHKAEPIPYGHAHKSTVPALRHGAITEPQAVGLFWERHPELGLRRGETLYWHNRRQVFWSDHTAVSPDGIITTGPVPSEKHEWMVAALEVKCPYDRAKFGEWFLSRTLPDEHKAQTYWEMMVPDLEYAYFVSFDPRAKEGVDYFEVRVDRDFEYEAQLKEKAERFLIGHLAHEKFQPIEVTAKSMRGIL